jgi:crotonobetainyl-CoA:carnitine CoA-transferase CaiB-like acyl-CoA transferase
MSTTPLAGIRILDLTTTVSGPISTLRLAQYGAEVIKVETRDGDVLRSLGGRSPSGAHSGQYLHLNRGKRAICLDLKASKGRAVIERLLETTDVLVSNMRPEALDRLGLGVALRERFPALIHCTITGFGPGGPYRGRPAYDSVVQGASGLVGLHIQRDGAAAYVPLLLCDHIVGEITAGAVLAALFERARTGAGSAIEVPMLETMAAFVLQEHLSRATFQPPIGPPGDERVLASGTQPLKTKDGWISLTSNTDDQCRRLLTVIGKPELIEDPRFRSVADRVRNVGAWLALREAAMLERTSAEWLAAFAAADVPAMPCHTLATLIEDPHLGAVRLLQIDAHPIEGPILAIRPTVLHDGQPAAPGVAAGPVGHDTRAVLAMAGYTPEEAEALIAEGAAFAAP